MKQKSLILLASAFLAHSASASIVINMFAGELRTFQNALIPAGSLLQLVNLGTDGVFNPISVLDGSITGNEMWVSGDDSLITASFTSASRLNGSALTGSGAAFAMSGNNGQMQAAFEFATGAVPAGTKIGLRWFPDVAASNFASTILGEGKPYGQYTLQGVLPSQGLHGGDSWVAPSDGSNVTFDSLATASIGGFNSNAIGRASNVPIPEPTSAFLVAIGAAGLITRRRRQS